MARARPDLRTPRPPFWVALILVAVIATLAARDRDWPDVRSHVVETPHSDVQVHLIVARPAAREPGLMHYAEHLAWLNAIGSADRAPDRHSNAWVNDFAAGYWLSGATEDLPELLETLAAVFDPIDLPRDFAEQERDIVMREYDTDLPQDPDARADEAMGAFLFAGNAIAVSVIGTRDQIAALDYDRARALHAATHRPENAVLVAIGNVTPGYLREALAAVDWPDAPAPRAFAPPLLHLAPPDELRLTFPDPDAAPRMIWRRVVTLDKPVPFDLLEAQTALLSDILDANLPGGLAGPLRFDAAIARDFGVHVWPEDERTIGLRFIAAPDRGVTLAQLQAAFEAVLRDIAETGIPAATHERVLARFDGFWPDWQDREETAFWRADYVLERLSVLREPLPEREIRRLRGGLTPEASTALIARLAGKGRTAIAFIGPGELLP